MKIYEQRQHLKSLNLADLRSEVLGIESKIHKHALEVQFGKTKQVSTVFQLKKQLARTLTQANLMLKTVEKD